jgi:hypothetical protein
MFFLWILFAIPTLALSYVVYVIARADGVRLPDCVTPLAPMTFGATGRLGSYPHQRKREVKWISTKEFESLLCGSDDVIFIDLRTQAGMEPVPFFVANVLAIGPSQLLDMLRWLPDATGVVLYGTSDLCATVLWIARDICGSAPVYVLAETTAHPKVA